MHIKRLMGAILAGTMLMGSFSANAESLKDEYKIMLIDSGKQEETVIRETNLSEPMEYGVYVDQKTNKMPVKLYTNDQDKYLVPLRTLAESLGFKVEWDGEKQTVTLTRGAQYTAITIGKDSYFFARMAPITLGQEPILIEDQTYVPAEFLSEILKSEVAIGKNTIALRRDSKTAEITYDFSKSQDGFEMSFADLPVDATKEFYELDTAYKTVPVKGEESKGLYLKGNNHSDDLFMYTYKELGKDEGLKPNTTYMMTVDFDLASNVPAGMGGIGGSPGESVYIKAGVTTQSPKRVKGDDNHYRVAFDKGNQSREGFEIKNAGTIGNENLMDLSFQNQHFKTTVIVETNDEGKAYIVIGTDSGFEGLTEFYLDNVKVTYSTVIG